MDLSIRAPLGSREAMTRIQKMQQLPAQTQRRVVKSCKERGKPRRWTGCEYIRGTNRGYAFRPCLSIVQARFIDRLFSRGGGWNSYCFFGYLCREQNGFAG